VVLPVLLLQLSPQLPAAASFAAVAAATPTAARSPV
jgi:hypothetical protein